MGQYAGPALVRGFKRDGGPSSITAAILMCQVRLLIKAYSHALILLCPVTALGPSAVGPSAVGQAVDMVIIVLTASGRAPSAAP